MSRLFYQTMQDNAGNLLFGVSGTMRIAGSGTLATIYGDEALTVILPNPMTNHASFGSFKCFLGAGDYDFYMAKAGYTFETLTGVQGHGTMAQQDADAVAIIGGTANLTQATVVQGLGVGAVPVSNYKVSVVPNKSLGEGGMVIKAVGTDSNGYALSVSNMAGTVVGSIQYDGSATTYHGNAVITGGSAVLGTATIMSGSATLGTATILGGTASLTTADVVAGLGIGEAVNTTYNLNILHNKSSKTHSIVQKAVGTDAIGNAMIMLNIAGTPVGTIGYTGTETFYTTTSDARLKDAIEPLTGALDVVRALNPVAFRWRLDGSQGRGLLAHEVAEVVDGVISGDRDAVDDEGQIVPQMIDYSKLVPWLCGAIQTLAQQVEALTARLEAPGA